MQSLFHDNQLVGQDFFQSLQLTRMKPSKIHTVFSVVHNKNLVLIFENVNAIRGLLRKFAPRIHHRFPNKIPRHSDHSNPTNEVHTCSIREFTFQISKFGIFDFFFNGCAGNY